MKLCNGQDRLEFGDLNVGSGTTVVVPVGLDSVCNLLVDGLTLALLVVKPLFLQLGKQM